LRRFHAADAARPLAPTAVEKEFAFFVDDTKLVGRYDLVVERQGQVAILDFKTSAVEDAKAARRRAKESLQLDLYALAHLRTAGRLPDWVELRFVESGLSGGKRPTLEEAEATETAVRRVAGAIRRREFAATPSYMACGQCAFRDICPYTARGPEQE
jgi:DNA helicase-2/ATP-dependent DNA helicase PcrA